MTFPVLDWHINDQAYSESDAMAYLGRIPLLIDPNVDEPVWMQVQTNYPEGWNPVTDREKWTLSGDNYLVYPGLPPLAPAAMAWHKSEQVFVYPAGWVVVLEPEGVFTVARIMP